MYQILMADDEAIFLEFMQNILQWENYDCKICGCFGDGRQALEYMEAHQPDIAFIDISMPIMDGITVCRLAKEKDIATKLIITTAHDEFNFAYQGIKLGIDDYLLKPFSREELAETLQKVIHSFEKGEADPSSYDKMEEGSTKYEIMAHAINDYLEKNYGSHSLSLSVIASELGFESSYLRRVYKIATGITIMQRLEDIRIAESKQLLLCGRYHGQEISEMVGFSDQFYFSKRFKQITGMSPTEFTRLR